MANVFGKTLLGLTLGFVAVPATAQFEQEFQEGVTALRMGKPDEALAKFEAALAINPSDADALKLFQTTDQRVWEMLMVKDGEIGKIAKLLLAKARVGRTQKNRDTAAINQLVETAVGGGDYAERGAAMLSLMSDHGEFAVPALVAKIGDADDDSGQVRGILALRQIGRPATPALVEALKSDNDTLRTNAAAALAHIKDRRAAAALARLASNDSKEGVRYAAAKALEAIGVVAGADPVQLYIDAAASALSANGVGDDYSEVVWSLKDGELVATDVPAALYNFELAKKAAHDALALDPVNEQAKSLLARAYIAEVAAIRDSAARGDEAVAALAEKVPGLRMMAAATGPQALRRAVADSIASGNAAASVAAIELLGEVDDPTALGNSPLVAALDNADKRIGYAAALALSKAAGRGPVPAADRVVANLASAVTEESIRLIKIIDPSTGAAGVANAAFNGKRGLQGSVAPSAASAMGELYRFPNVDVVIVNEILPDGRPEAIISLIKKDERMANCKVLVLAKDVDAAAEKFGDTIDGTIQSPLSAENLQQAVSDALPADDDSRKRADVVAVAASQALAQLGSSSVNLGSALGNLGAQLNRDDTVAVPAAHALGNGGNVGNVESLLAALGGEGSLDLKVAAAQAIGRIYARSGQAPDGATFTKLLDALKASSDIKLSSAISEGLGRANLAPGDQLKLIDAIKGMVSIGGGSDEG